MISPEGRKAIDAALAKPGALRTLCEFTKLLESGQSGLKALRHPMYGTIKPPEIEGCGDWRLGTPTEAIGVLAHLAVRACDGSCLCDDEHAHIVGCWFAEQVDGHGQITAYCCVEYVRDLETDERETIVASKGGSRGDGPSAS